MITAIDKPIENIEAEQIVISCMFYSPESLDAAVNLLNADMFYRLNHQEIFRVLARMSREGKPVTGITVQEEFGNDLEPFGGPVHFHELVNNSMPSDEPYVAYYANIIKQKWIARKLTEAYQSGIKALSDGEDPFNNLASIHQLAIELESDNKKAEIVHIGEMLRDAYDWLSEFTKSTSELFGIPSGINDLDKFTGGWQDGDLIIICARPSHGKTAAALQFALASAKKGFPTGVISLEMGLRQLALRIYSHDARVDSARMKTKKTTDEDWERMADSMGRLGGKHIGLYVYNSSNLHINRLSIIARQMVSRFGLKILFIDYLTLMTSEKMSTRALEVGDMARKCKEVARQLNIPVVLIAQENRSIEGKGDPRPTLSAIRDSGDIEAHADIVIGVYNEPQMSPPQNGQLPPAEFLVLKNRNGATGKVNVFWDGANQKFQEKSYREEVRLQ